MKQTPIIPLTQLINPIDASRQDQQNSSDQEPREDLEFARQRHVVIGGAPMADPVQCEKTEDCEGEDLEGETCEGYVHADLVRVAR